MNVYDSIVKGSKRWPKRAREEINNAVLEYLYDGTEPDLEGMNQYAAGTFEMLLPVLENQRKQRANASKPRRKRTKQKAVPDDSQNVSQTLANQLPEDNQDALSELTIKTIPYSYISSSTSEEDIGIGTSSTVDLQVGSGFAIPTVDEIRDYCAANLMRHCNPEEFFNFYASQGWKKSNGMPITDWKPLIQSWESRDKLKAETERPKQDFSKYATDNWERG